MQSVPVLSPGPLSQPAACNIEKLGIGLGTRLENGRLDFVCEKKKSVQSLIPEVSANKVNLMYFFFSRQCHMAHFIPHNNY